MVGHGGCSQARERFYQFLWRPRAPSLLSHEAEADLLKRLKEFSKRYDEEDNALLDEVQRPTVVVELLHQHGPAACFAAVAWGGSACAHVSLRRAYVGPHCDARALSRLRSTRRTHSWAWALLRSGSA